MFFMFADKVKRSKIEKLYFEYNTIMFNTAYDILGDEQFAEDVVHESFVNIIDFIDKLPDDEELKCNFFVTVSRNIALNVFNKRKKYNEYKYSSDVTEEDPEENNPADIYISRESARHIKNIILSLDSKYKDVLYMNLVYGLSYEEISHILGLKTDTVRKRANRAKKMVANKLRKEYEDETGK